MEEIKLIFKGDDVPRESFEDIFLDFFEDILGGLKDSSRSIQFYMLLWEMIKNIYDHAEGRGEVIFSIQDNDIHFVVRDFGTASFDLEQIKKVSSTKFGNRMNYGLGISGGLIEGYARGIDVDLKIDTSHGFCYSGIYHFR